MKRSILIVFGLMLTALNGWSNDYNYLVFVTNTGPRSIAVEDLEMTVSDGKLVVRSGADGESLRPFDPHEDVFLRRGSGFHQ